jgi:hypothetical protein
MDPQAELALKLLLTKMFYFFTRVKGITLRSEGIFASQRRLSIGEQRGTYLGTIVR